MSKEQSSLREIQVAIARALTESEMSPTDCGRMNLSATELEQSRETLIRKRISQTRHLLPRTASILAKDFSPLFREFAATRHFNGSNAMAMDAIAFAKWLEGKTIAVPWIGQLALWESMDCLWLVAKIYVKFYRHRYDFSRPFQAGHPTKKNSFWCCLRVFGWLRKWRWMG